MDETTVKVPIRLTSVLPAWSYPHQGWHGLFLRTAPDANGKVREWTSLYRDDHLARKDGWIDPFSEVILFRAGTHEGYVYFGPDHREDDKSALDEPFNTLQFMDGSEEMIMVDLTRFIPPAPRARFDRCRPDNPALPDNVLVALRNGDDYWSDLPDLEPALLGDTVAIAAEEGGLPSLDLTVLGGPEAGDGASLRVPVRVVARHDSGPRGYSVGAWLSTPPDTYGRIHHTLPVLDRFSDSRRPQESLDLDGMAMGEVREGFLYFAPHDDQDYTVKPDEPFTILWYGPDWLELPMDLSVSR